MKNLALIFAMATTLFFDANAMQAERSANDQNGVPIILYKVNVIPPVEVLQVPSKQIVSLGGMTARSINLSCKEYNGIKTYAPIDLRSDMSRDQMGLSLCSSFGVDSIEFREGVIPGEDFSKMFPFFTVNR